MKITLLGSLLLATSLAPAATIGGPVTVTGFTATNTSGSAFTTTINSAFDSNTGRITNSTVFCTLSTTCSGQVAQFSLMGTGLTAPTPISINIDGSLSAGNLGKTDAAGIISILGFPSAFPFTIPFGSDGNFNKSIVTGVVPATLDGTFNFTGTLSLTLGGGQTLTLPSSLSFTLGTPSTAATPEPGTLGLLGVSLAGVVFAVRRRLA